MFPTHFLVFLIIHHGPDLSRGPCNADYYSLPSEDQAVSLRRDAMLPSHVCRGKWGANLYVILFGQEPSILSLVCGGDGRRGETDDRRSEEGEGQKEREIRGMVKGEWTRECDKRRMMRGSDAGENDHEGSKDWSVIRKDDQKMLREVSSQSEWWGGRGWDEENVRRIMTGEWWGRVSAVWWREKGYYEENGMRRMTGEWWRRVTVMCDEGKWCERNDEGESDDSDWWEWSDDGVCDEENKIKVLPS